MTPTKDKKAIGKQIESCILKACAHFKYDKPSDVYVARSLKARNAQRARAAVWQHMRDCGYVGPQMSNIFKKETDYINKQVRKYVPFFSKRDMEFMRSLPFVDGGKEIA